MGMKLKKRRIMRKKELTINGTTLAEETLETAQRPPSFTASLGGAIPVKQSL